MAGRCEEALLQAAVFDVEEEDGADLAGIGGEVFCKTSRSVSQSVSLEHEVGW